MVKRCVSPSDAERAGGPKQIDRGQIHMFNSSIAS